ncbi:MAG TPA: radical SAM protein [Allosphingosinicella sp.]|jgi:radical SAM superfamily enzyme YgiQ (UPF0313 family)
MKVCLIQVPPASEFDRHWARFPVLGLAYLAAAVRAAGHEVILLDGKLDMLSADEICDRAVAAGADIVGLTCMTVEFPMVVRIASRIRARSAVPIVVGGAHVNAVKQQALEECAAIDFACVGEGEYALNELIAAIGGEGALEEITGLCWRRGGEIVVNPTRPYPKDYDLLPFPAWDMFKVSTQIPVLTHRGCPYRCTFCGHNSGFKTRFRSVGNVVAELRYAVETFKPEVIRFEDETFGLDLKRTKEIIAGIIEHKLHRKVTFSAQTRVDRVDAEFMKLLREANFETLELGVESGNPDVLKSIKKGITLDQVDRAVKLAKAENLSVWCKFILGHPNETRSTIRDTIRYIARLNPQRLSVSIMTPFPGTPIHEMAVRGEGGYRLLSTDWKDFDKYSTGALELDGLPLWRLKMYQILCYLMLYLRNGRVRELFGLVREHRVMAFSMLGGAFKALGERLFSRRPRPLPITEVAAE